MAPSDNGANRMDGAAACLAGLGDADRWRALLSMSAAFAFETDAAGRLTFISPQTVLGWESHTLLGRPAKALLAGPSALHDPFARGPGFAHRRALFQQADGRATLLNLTAAPLPGDRAGMRGVASEVTGQDNASAASLRRNEVVERILWQVRQEVAAPRMMAAVLEGLLAALDAEGSAIVDLLAGPGGEALLHGAGEAPSPTLSGMMDSLMAETLDPVVYAVEGRPVMACPSYTKFGTRAGLCVWRSPGARRWEESDALLVSSVMAVIRMVLEHEAMQLEMAKQARTDPLTGLVNRRSFVEEVGRRIDRLDREGLPGTLMYVDLDHFKQLNDSCGHEAGDRALVQAAVLLRNTVRPADIVARLGGDEFAMWLDGSDELTAAERAERLRVSGPAIFAAVLPDTAPLLSTSVGIAARHPHAGEALEEVMRRADLAMYDVKRAGRAHWKVARNPSF